MCSIITVPILWNSFGSSQCFGCLIALTLAPTSFEVVFIFNEKNTWIFNTLSNGLQIHTIRSLHRYVAQRLPVQNIPITGNGPHSTLQKRTKLPTAPKQRLPRAWHPESQFFLNCVKCFSFSFRKFIELYVQNDWDWCNLSTLVNDIDGEGCSQSKEKQNFKCKHAFLCHYLWKHSL